MRSCLASTSSPTVTPSSSPDAAANNRLVVEARLKELVAIPAVDTPVKIEALTESSPLGKVMASLVKSYTARAIEGEYVIVMTKEIARIIQEIERRPELVAEHVMEEDVEEEEDPPMPIPPAMAELRRRAGIRGEEPASDQ